jgi:hypothetical protein
VPDLIRYTCQCEVLPSIEAALTANGCTVEINQRQTENFMVVMSQGTVSILLTQVQQGALAIIEIWGVAGAVIAHLLEALPVSLRRVPFPMAV